MGSRRGPKKRNEDTVPCACGCGTLIFQFGTDGRPRRYARGHQFKNNTYGQKPYSLERILEQVEPLRPFCQCGCGEKLAIPEFLQQKGRGLRSIQSYWQKHPNKKFHGNWTLRTEHFIRQSDPLSIETLGLIYGTLLGDGSITYPNQHSRFPRLAWTHGDQQQAWMEYKASRLASLQPRVYTATNPGFGERSVCCYTTCHPDLVNVFEQVKDRAGRKSVSASWLAQISPEGLAWWYMDDGSLSLSPQGSPQIQFHTEGYSSAENHLIAEWLTSLGYSAKVRFYTRGHSDNRYDYVAMGAKAARNLLANLRPFAIPSMDYKFGDGRICEPRWD